MALAHLVDERPRPVAREVVADVLWGDELPRTWDATLRGVIGKLRRAFADAGLDPAATLVTRPEGYQLLLPDDALVDVEEAEAATARAESRLDHSPADALRHAQRAIELTAAPLLAHAAGAWVERRQRRWRDLRLRALEIMAAASSSVGDGVTAAASAGEAVMLEPLRESAHVALMTAHAAAGNRGEALRAYERCRQTLVEELGVGPSAATEAAYLRLLDDVTPGAQETTRPQSPPPALPSQLRTQGLPRLVGRQAALGQLVGAWRRSLEGRLALALVSGEAGIGKTRLAGELAAAVEPATVLYGRSDEDAVVPYQPFIQAIRQHLAVTPDAPERMPEPLVPALGRVIPALAARTSTRGEDDRRHLFDAVATYLTTCVRGPTLLVLDDLHWAARGSLSMLRHVLHTPAPGGMFVVATCRAGEPTDEMLEQLVGVARDHQGEHVALTGLASDDAAALAAALAGRSLAPELARALSSATRGNPFLLSEITHHLRVTGGLDPATAISTKLDGAQPGDALLSALDADVPTGVRHLVRARVQALDPAATALLDAAAVTDASFEADLLGAITGLDHTTVSAAIDAAVEARLLEPAGHADRYRFVHAIVRRAIYTRLGPRRRARLHRDVVDALEERHHDEVEAVLPQLAHHARRAAGGALAVTRAVEYARRAGEHAMARFAYEDAADHYEAAAELALQPAASATQRAALLLATGDARSRSGDVPGARQLYLAGADIARETGDGAVLAEAALRYGGLWEGAGQVNETLVRLLEEALAVTDPGDSGPRAMLLGRLGRALYYADDWEGRGRRLCEEACAMAVRSGDDQATRETLVARHMLLWAPQHVQERLALADDMVDRAHAAGDMEGTLRGQLYRITALIELDDLASAAADVTSYQKLAAELRQPLHTWHAHYLAATLAMAEGRFDDAEELVVTAAAAGEDAHDRDAGHFFGIQLLALRREQGRLGELTAAVEAFADQYPAVPAWRAAAAYVASETGRLTDARRALEQVKPLRRDANWMIATTLMAEAVATVGDAARARSLYEALLPHDRQNIVIGPAVAINRTASYHLGRLAATSGNHDRAVRHFEDALGTALARPGTPDAAHTGVHLARSLRARARPGDLQRARRLLADASGTARRLGMAALLEESSLRAS